MANLVECSIENHVMHVELNNPEKKNTLIDQVVEGLYDAISAARRDPSVRAVVLSGRGDLFCGGGDLDHFKTNPLADGYTDIAMYRLMTEMFACEKPIIAAVHGAAVGGGTTILLSCDFVVAAEETSFLLPFTSLGICTELGSSYLLPLAVGLRRAAKWVLMAQPFGAQEALDGGLITTITAQPDLMDTAFGYANRLAALPPSAVRNNKVLLRRAHQAALKDNFDREWEILQTAFQSEELQEAITAFKEKRAADFSRFS